jgi:hypothetical protein
LFFSCQSTIFKPLCFAGAGPDLSTENLLQSIAAALHLNNQPITGQAATKAALQKNAAVAVNVDQPLIQVHTAETMKHIYMLP